MKRAIGLFDLLHESAQGGSFEKLFARNALVDTLQLLIDDPSSTQIHVSDFTVPHLSFRESNKAPTGLQSRIRTAAVQAVDKGCVCLVDGRDLLVFGDSPAIEDHQHASFSHGIDTIMG